MIIATILNVNTQMRNRHGGVKYTFTVSALFKRLKVCNKENECVCQLLWWITVKISVERASWLVGYYLTSKQHARVAQGRICSNKCTCFHVETEAADQTLHFIRSQYLDIGLISPSTDPITPGPGRAAIREPVFPPLVWLGERDSTPAFLTLQVVVFPLRHRTVVSRECYALLLLLLLVGWLLNIPATY